MHTFYNCPFAGGLDIEDFRDTNYLSTRAIDEAHRYPCLWFRGILTAFFTQVPDNTLGLSDDFCFRYDLHSPPCGDWPSGDYFGDCGGGKYTSFPTLRRCGVGLPMWSIGSLNLGFIPHCLVRSRQSPGLKLRPR